MNAQVPPPPQQAKPSAAQAAAMAAAARPTKLTGRAALLAVVICAIALSLAYPVREYIAQRQQIDQLLALQQANAAQVQALEQQDGKLTQTWYVEQQAEDELHMCFPHEQCYEIVPGASAQAAKAKRQAVTNPWYATLWQSVKRADAEPGRVIAARDVAAVTRQLGRQPRGLRAIAHRCPCGLPDVVETAPRLPDGTPFPTLYYLTCPRAAAAIGSLEAAGSMREMTERLADEQTKAAYDQAHRDYLARRDAAAVAAGVEPLPAGAQSAGGMPDRVKCLHALVAHELAVPGSNPFGREALAAIGPWWSRGPCVTVSWPPPISPDPPGGEEHL